MQGRSLEKAKNMAGKQILERYLATVDEAFLESSQLKSVKGRRIFFPQTPMGFLQGKRSTILMALDMARATRKIALWD